MALFIDWFAGMGCFRKGMEISGHKCIGYVEIDKHARITYQANFNTEGEWTEFDVKEVRASNIPYADIWCFGFPCKDLSWANSKRTGLDGEKSGLFWTMCDLLQNTEKRNKPKWLFIENVKGLLTANKGIDFLKFQVTLDELGYNIEWELLNSKDFEIPQKRERTYVIGCLREAC